MTYTDIKQHPRYAAFAAHVQAGLSAAEIARAVGLSRERVGQLLKRLGLRAVDKRGIHKLAGKMDYPACGCGRIGGLTVEYRAAHGMGSYMCRDCLRAK